MHSAFSNFLKTQEWDNHAISLSETTAQQVENALNQEGKGGLANLKALLSPMAGEKYIEEMAKLSFSLTRKRFGNAVRLFAPMYLSNECKNICDYCGFSMHNQIPRKTLTDAEILREAGILKNMALTMSCWLLESPTSMLDLITYCIPSIYFALILPIFRLKYNP